MEMHDAEICLLRQVSTDNNNNNNSSSSAGSDSEVIKTTTAAKMEQPTVIIPNPLTNLSIQSHIATYGNGDLEPISYQHHSGESSPLMHHQQQQHQQQHHHQSLDQHHQNVWAAYNDNQYSQRSLVIAPVIPAQHFTADVHEMRDHLHYQGTTSASVMDDNNNHTLHHLASSLKDEHCLHASPVSHHGGSHHGSPEHGHNGGSVQFLNLGSAQSTISENLSQLKYPRQHEEAQQQQGQGAHTHHSDSRSSPVSQGSEYESDLQNFTQLTSVVPSRVNTNGSGNNNNLALYSPPTSQAAGTGGVSYDNVR